MPWKEASPMDQRMQFIADHLRDTLTITELCELYGYRSVICLKVTADLGPRSPQVAARP